MILGGCGRGQHQTASLKRDLQQIIVDPVREHILEKECFLSGIAQILRPMAKEAEHGYR